MNYIGSKSTLLPFIVHTINQVVGVEVESFADLFAGTGCVGANYRKQGASVIANDIQYYSYVINKHLIEGDNDNQFERIDMSKSDCQTLFPDRALAVQQYLKNIEGKEGFIYTHYCEQGTKSQEITRLYFSNDNAKKCDAIRQQIEQWYVEQQINQMEYFYLLTSLLESVDRVANTASVYAAFLKRLKASAVKPLSFEFTPSHEPANRGVAYNEDANSLIKRIEGQVLYLDPPYNHRQYAPNYHILETIARYDNPVIKGVTGLRDYSKQKSSYCTKQNAEESFCELIENAKFDYIFLSYNNEGIISEKYIEKVMKSRGRYTRVEKEYPRFKADRNREYKSDKTIEYIHCLKCDKN